MRKTRPATTLRSIAANVQRMRKQRSMTQEVLAEQAGLDLRHLQRIERAGADFRVSALMALAGALDVPVGRLARPATLPPAERGRPRARRSK